jgi:hypothetical protein
MPASVLLTAPQQSIPVNGSPGRTLIVGVNSVAGGGFGTIQAAINAAQQGDTIFVQPGSYAENLTVTTDYVTLIGAQVSGFGRPDVEPASGIALQVRAQGFKCARMRFATLSAADAVEQDGNGFEYRDCVFDGDTNSGSSALLRLVGHPTKHSQSASEGLIIDCLFRNSAAKGLVMDSAAIAGAGVGSTDNRVIGCKFTQNTNADVETAKTGAGGDYSVKFLLMKDCVFADKNKATYIDITTNADGAAGNQNGTIDGCYFASDTMTTTKVKMVGTAFTMIGCYDTVGIFDASGLD